MILSPDDQVLEYTARGWWGERTLIDLFLDNVEHSADAMAVVDPPNRAALTPGEPLRLTYAQAKAATDRLADALLEAGVGKDDVVMVQLPNIVELVVTYLACARIGAILSPLPVQFRTHELRHVLELTEPKVFITTRSFGEHDYVAMVQSLQPEFPSVLHVIALGDDLPAGVGSLAAILSTEIDTSRVDAHAAANPSSANDVFTICWTSGTVAEPKGVPRSHNLWIAIAYATVDAAGLQDGDALLNPFPLVNMSGIGGMLVPWLLTRGKLAMHHPLDLPVFLAQMGGEEIAYTVAPPVLLNLLLLRPGPAGERRPEPRQEHRLGVGAPLAVDGDALAGGARHPDPELLRRQRGHCAGQRPGRHPRPGGARALLPSPGRAGLHVVKPRGGHDRDQAAGPGDARGRHRAGRRRESSPSAARRSSPATGSGRA